MLSNNNLLASGGVLFSARWFSLLVNCDDHVLGFLFFRGYNYGPYPDSEATPSNDCSAMVYRQYDIRLRALEVGWTLLRPSSCHRHQYF